MTDFEGLSNSMTNSGNLRSPTLEQMLEAMQKLKDMPIPKYKRIIFAHPSEWPAGESTSQVLVLPMKVHGEYEEVLFAHGSLEGKIRSVCREGTPLDRVTTSLFGIHTHRGIPDFCKIVPIPEADDE